jgi:hypothetical protein
LSRPRLVASLLEFCASLRKTAAFVSKILAKLRTSVRFLGTGESGRKKPLAGSSCLVGEKFGDACVVGGWDGRNMLRDGWDGPDDVGSLV